MPPCYGPQRREHNPRKLKCGWYGCNRWFKNASGRTKHIRSCHSAQAVMYPNRWRERQLSQHPSLGVHDGTPPAGMVVSHSQSLRNHPSPSLTGLSELPLPDFGVLLGNVTAQTWVDEEYPDWHPRELHQQESPSLQPHSPMIPNIHHSSPHSRLPQLSPHSLSPRLPSESSSDNDNDPVVTVYHPSINGEHFSPYVSLPKLIPSHVRTTL